MKKKYTPKKVETSLKKKKAQKKRIPRLMEKYLQKH